MKLVQIVGLRLRPFILMQILRFPLLLDTNIFTHLWRLNLRSCTSCEVIGSFCLTRWFSSFFFSRMHSVYWMGFKTLLQFGYKWHTGKSLSSQCHDLGSSVQSSKERTEWLNRYGKCLPNNPVNPRYVRYWQRRCEPFSCIYFSSNNGDCPRENFDCKQGDGHDCYWCSVQSRIYAKNQEGLW